MYYMEPIVQFKNSFDFSTKMYYVAPTVHFLDQTVDINFLKNCQDNVLTKLKVLLHNVENMAKNANLQMPNIDTCDEKLKEMQENVIRRIVQLSSKIEKVALETKINISQISIGELELIQSELDEKVYALKNKIEYLVSTNKGVVLMDKKRPANISIFASSNRPPLSVLLLLSGLKSKGYKVACMSYFNKNQITNNITMITNYISNNLNISDKRQNYDVIVSLIWKDLDINDCIYQDNVFKETKMIGEMIALVNLCICLSFDIREYMTNIESINDDLFYRVNTKRALILLNKLIPVINDDSEVNLAVSVFMFSCLVHSKTIDKINDQLKEKLYSVLTSCGSGAIEFINMKL